MLAENSLEKEEKAFESAKTKLESTPKDDQKQIDENQKTYSLAMQNLQAAKTAETAAKNLLLNAERTSEKQTQQAEEITQNNEKMKLIKEKAQNPTE